MTNLGSIKKKPQFYGSKTNRTRRIYAMVSKQKQIKLTLLILLSSMFHLTFIIFIHLALIFGFKSVKKFK